MSIEGVSARKTGELVDEWAHDAGVVSNDRHVKGSVVGQTGTAMHADRQHGTPKDAAKKVGMSLAVDVLPELGEHALLHAGQLALGRAVGCAGFLIGATYLAYKCGEELVAAEEKALEIKDAFSNDAINVALAKSLAFHPGFGESEALKRPGVNAMAGQLGQKLAEPNNPMKPVFQSRADEGFVAAERAYEATKHLPLDQQVGARTQWLKDNGFASRFETDVAFGKGVEYFQWTQSADASRHGIDPKVESAKVHARTVPPQPLRVTG